MPRIDRDDVLARTDLAELLDELCGTRHGEGRRARWHCPQPEHPDVHPSVTVSFDRQGVQRWRCWSQGHGGTAIDALVARGGHTVREALQELAHRCGADGDRPLTKRVEPPRVSQTSPKLSSAAMLYSLVAQSMLWKPPGKAVLDYLVERRGIDPDVLRINRVGADPGNSSLARRAGLPTGGPRAVLPALDSQMHVKYFQVRPIDQRHGEAKYLNPPRPHGSNPGYGWTHPAGGLGSDAIVICEGLPDAYVANAAGYTAVAVLGTGNATPGLADKLAREIGDRPVILAFDGDDAGRTAALHLGSNLWRRGIMVVDLPVPAGSDLNSWVHSARHLVPHLGVPSPANSPGPVAPSPGIAGP